MARAAEVYGQRQRFAEEAIAHATALKVDALTLMGEFLKVAEKNRGGGEPGIGRRGAECPDQPEGHSYPPTLAEVGITSRESSQAQALATLKQRGDEGYERIRAGETPVSAVPVAV